MAANRSTFLARLAGSAAVLGCVGSARRLGAQTTGGELVRVGTTPDENALPVVYALRTGLFSKAGLDVRVQQLANGSAIASGVAGGSFEVGKAAIQSVFSAHLRGVPFVFVAPAGLYSAKVPYGELLVRKDAPIRSAKDLEGKTLASGTLNSIDLVALDAWMDRSGADYHKVHFVEIPLAAAAAAIEAGRIDGAVINRPQLDAALASGTLRVLAPVYDAIGTTFLSSAWFSTTDWTTKAPQTVTRFARVLDDAARYCNEHHAETAAMLADWSQISLQVIESMPRAIFGTSLDPATIQPVIDDAAKYGLLPRAFAAQELIFSAAG